MTFGDEMKRKADEVHLEEKARALGDAIAELAKSAVAAAGGFAADNKGKVDEALTKATTKANERTDGKYAAHIDKAMDQVSRYVDKLATTAQGSKSHDSTVWGPADGSNPSGVQDTLGGDDDIAGPMAEESTDSVDPVEGAPRMGSATMAAEAEEATPDAWGQATDRH